MCFVGFNSVPNLIVIMFNLLYPVFHVGFICKGYVWKRESVKTQDIEDWSVFAGSSRVSILRSDACALHDWNKKSQDRMETSVFRECLASKTFPRDTRETFCFSRISFLIYSFYAYTIYTHITHRCWGVLLRENPSHKPWELKIVIPIILYTNTCGFSLIPSSPFPYHWEVDSPNTYHTLSECPVRF